MTYAGLDYGTSNCSIAVWEGGSPKLLPLYKNDTNLPSAMFNPYGAIEVDSVDEVELSRRVANAKYTQTTEATRVRADNATVYSKIRDLQNQITERIHEGQTYLDLEERLAILQLSIRRINTLSDAEIISREKGVLIREQIREAKKLEEERARKLINQDGVLFGMEAVEMHSKDPLSGTFFKSPKSFLGVELTPSHREVFTKVVAGMLENLKMIAESSLAETIDQVVIGRPVNYGRIKLYQKKGNKQAIEIMEQAASMAGFKEVEFLYEPVAAAIDYERQLSREEVVLIVDIGGGTTDCTMIRLGPKLRNKADRSEDILANQGALVGGNDFDFKLNFRNVMPLFGKNICHAGKEVVPNDLFWTAIATNDLPRQQFFRSIKYKNELDTWIRRSNNSHLLERLRVLRDKELNYWLNFVVEQAKKHLSNEGVYSLPLDEIEPGLECTLEAKNIEEAAFNQLREISGLIKQVIDDAGTKPDTVYITGGMAKSPIIINTIKSSVDEIPFVQGDAFGSVVSGLTTWSKRCFS